MPFAPDDNAILTLPRARCGPLPDAGAWRWEAAAGRADAVWLPRPRAEVDEGHLQLVPYLLLLDVRGAAWCYRRAGGDARVLGRVSCGLGGHVERQDARGDLAATLRAALARELAEELGPADAATLVAHGPRGWLYEHRSAIGRVHLGVIFTARWPHAHPPRPLEPALQALGFRPLDALAADPDCELWSRLAAGFVLAHGAGEATDA